MEKESIFKPIVEWHRDEKTILCPIMRIMQKMHGYNNGFCCLRWSSNRFHSMSTVVICVSSYLSLRRQIKLHTEQ